MLASTPTEQLRRLYDPLDHLVWLTDDEGAATFVNRAWTVFTGRGEAASLGYGFLAAFDEADRAAVVPVLREARAAGTLAREYRLHTAGGAARWVQVRARRLIGEDGAPYWLGTCTDVHDRKLAETRAEALATLAEELARAKAVREVHAVLRGPGARAAGACGVSLYQAEGDALRAALWDHCLSVTRHAEVMAPDQAASVARGGAARFFGAELRLDAQFAPYLPPCARNFALLPLWGGEAAGVLLLCFEGEQVFDEAQRRFLQGIANVCGLALARAREYEGRLRERALLSSLLDASPAAICFFDADLRFVRANAEAGRLSGHLPETLIGRALADLEPGVGSALRAMLQEALERDEPITGVPLTQPLPDGGFRHWLASFYPVRGAAGGRLGAGSLALDISDEVRANEALRAADARFRLLAERGRDLISLHAPDGTGLYASPSFERVLGVSPESLVGRSVFDLSELEDRAALRGAHAQLLAGQSVPLLTHQMRRRGGEPRWLESSVHGLYGEHGELLEFQVASRDVTRRFLAERELREREERYRTLVQGAGVGIARLTPQGRWFEVNPAFERMLGYSRQELLSTDFQSVTHPDDLTPEMLRSFERLVAGEISQYTQEKRYLRKDGGVLWASVTVAAVRDEAGRHLSQVSVLEDITPRKTAEAQLARSREQLDLAFQAGQLGLWDRDIASGTETWSARQVELFGLDVSNLNGEAVILSVADFYARVHPEDRARVQARMEAALASGDECRDEYRVRLPGGGERWIRSVGRVYRDAQGRPARMTGVNDDVTERKTADLALQRLNADLEARVEERTVRLGELHAELVAFAASVSRDIQEPLRRIAGFTGLLERRLRGQVDARTAEYLHFIQSDGARVARLVEDLSQFAAYGQRELRLAEVSLPELTAQVRSDVESFARGRAVEWTLGNLPVVRGDAMLLRQALAALLHNALKFTRGRDPARIEISAAAREHEVEVCVRDNGVGFAPSEAPRLFSVFTRLHGDRYDGAGVGLANVRRIVNRHGGRVWAEGEENVGAAFFFTLPTVPPQDAPDS